MRLNYYFIALLAFSPFIACKENQPVQQKLKGTDTSASKKEVQKDPTPQHPDIHYHFVPKSVWKQKDTFDGYNHKTLLAAINRVDVQHLQRLDSFLVPDQYNDSLSTYFPFPAYADALKEVQKIILFSYPTQTFAAYENGKLILTGPTNMGKKNSPTPTGLFFCNWKSKETRSTVDNEWILKWNFNVSNLGGVGFHQYALPGYPASHSCMRLWAEQAQFLYNWAEQWKLKDNKLVVKGTPVIVYGAYPFGQPRPWFVLANDGKALDITPQQLAEIVEPHKQVIMEEQQKRNQYLSQSTDSSSKPQ